MRVAVFAAVLLALTAVSAPASAKGCLKGAVVGGVAGHYAGHHGVLAQPAASSGGITLTSTRERIRIGPALIDR